MSRADMYCWSMHVLSVCLFFAICFYPCVCGACVWVCGRERDREIEYVRESVCVREKEKEERIK